MLTTLKPASEALDRGKGTLPRSTGVLPAGSGGVSPPVPTAPPGGTPGELAGETPALLAAANVRMSSAAPGSIEHCAAGRVC
jgi:hypothetical protein